jgi:aspartokinase-like uncharacterized kinase
MNAWVIKIGGSLYDSKYLIRWLTAISECSIKQIVIVPGGGPFADQVRRADEKFSLKAVHSHNMAVMAMQQYGAVLASLCTSLILANSKDKINQAWANEKVAIWEPYDLVQDQCRLDKTWEVTSDSLALWLADVLEIKNVLLVKSSKKVLEDASIASLTNNKCIDTSVQKLSEKYQLNIQFLHKSKIDNLHELLYAN